MQIDTGIRALCDECGSCSTLLLDPNSFSFGRGVSGRLRMKNQLSPSSEVRCRERLEQWIDAHTCPADWSRVHGFFAAMGGFVDGNEMLSLKDIERLVQNDEIEYPIVTREEIQDKSKGDAVTKALVVLQTTWFLLQCAARGSQRLALTELELATAAFALLNIIIYALWWDKPLDVQCHIVVRRRSIRDGARCSQQNQEGSQPTEESASHPQTGTGLLVTLSWMVERCLGWIAGCVSWMGVEGCLWMD